MASIGVDIGALFLKAVRLDEAGRIVASVYERHRGEPADVLSEALDRLNVQPDDPVGLTGCNAELFAAQLQVPYRDVTLCQIDAVRRIAPDAFAVMDIGGGSATLIQLDGKGKFEGYSTNSMCAAGTGSFLDEQAGRLGISYEDTRGYLHNPNPPTIATRCTVFAKSDLIHRQQEGCSRMDMWSGLCRGMTRTVLGTLLNGRPLEGKTVLIGGVALNQEVVSWLKHDCPGLIDVPEQPELDRGVWRRTLREAGAKRPGARSQTRGHGTKWKRPVSLAAHAREVDASVLRHRAELRGRGRQRGARHALARRRTGPRLSGHRHRLDQHQGHPDRRGGRRHRRHLPEDVRRSHRGDQAAPAGAADARGRQGLSPRHPGRGHHRERPEDCRPRRRRRRHRQRDLRARGGRRARRSLDRHHLRDRRAGRQVHARGRRPHPRREHELRVRGRHGLVCRGAGAQARLQGRRSRAGRAGPAAAARHGSLHGVHGAGSRPAHPHRLDAAGSVRGGDGVGGEELPEQGGRQPVPQPRQDLLPGRHGAEPGAGGGIRAAARRRNRRLAVLPRDGGVRRGAAHAPRDAGAGAGCQRLPRPRPRPARDRAVEGHVRAVPEPLRDHAYAHRRRRGAVVGLHVRARAGRAEDAPDAPQPPAAAAQEALARGRARHRRARRCARHRHPAGAEHLHLPAALAPVLQPPRVPDSALRRHDAGDPRSRRADERGGVLLPGQGVPGPRRVARRERRRRLRLPAGDEERGAQRARHDIDLLPVRPGLPVVRPRRARAERHGERAAALADHRPPPRGADAAEAPRPGPVAAARPLAPPDRGRLARGVQGAARVRAAPSRRRRESGRGGPRQRREAPGDRRAALQHLRQRAEPGPAGEARRAGADGPSDRHAHARLLAPGGAVQEHLLGLRPEDPGRPRGCRDQRHARRGVLHELQLRARQLPADLRVRDHGQQALPGAGAGRARVGHGLHDAHRGVLRRAAPAPQEPVRAAAVRGAAIGD